MSRRPPQTLNVVETLEGLRCVVLPGAWQQRLGKIAGGALGFYGLFVAGSVVGPAFDAAGLLPALVAVLAALGPAALLMRVSPVAVIDVDAHRLRVKHRNGSADLPLEDVMGCAVIAYVDGFPRFRVLLRDRSEEFLIGEHPTDDLTWLAARIAELAQAARDRAPLPRETVAQVQALRRRTSTRQDQ